MNTTFVSTHTLNDLVARSVLPASVIPRLTTVFANAVSETGITCANRPGMEKNMKTVLLVTERAFAAGMPLNMYVSKRSDIPFEWRNGADYVFSQLQAFYDSDIRHTGVDLMFQVITAAESNDKLPACPVGYMYMTGKLANRLQFLD